MRTVAKMQRVSRASLHMLLKSLCEWECMLCEACPTSLRCALHLTEAARAASPTMRQAAVVHKALGKSLALKTCTPPLLLLCSRSAHGHVAPAIHPCGLTLSVQALHHGAWQAAGLPCAAPAVACALVAVAWTQHRFCLDALTCLSCALICSYVAAKLLPLFAMCQHASQHVVCTPSACSKRVHYQ